MSTGKRIILFCAAGLFLVTGGLLLCLNLADFNQYKPLVAEQVRNATGRELVMDGPLELEVFFAPRLTVGQVRLGNMAGGSRADMLRIGRIEAEVRVLPLLTGRLDIGRLVLHDADLLLETDATGRGNWQFARADAKPPPASGEPTLPPIHDLQFHDATLVYHNGVRDTRQALHVDVLQIMFPGYERPLRFHVDGMAGRSALTLDGSIDSLATLLAGEATQVKLGSNGQDVGGEITLQLAGTRPRLDATLAFKHLQLGDQPNTDPRAASRTGTRRERLFPAEPFDAGALSVLDGEIRLSGDRLRIGRLAVEDVAAIVKLENGNLDLERFRFRSGGQLEAAGNFAMRNGAGNLRLKVRGSDLDLGAMLTDREHAERVTDARAGVHADLHGNGASPAALMANLDGDLVLEAGPGTIDNAYLDLAGEDLVSRLVNALDPNARQEKTTQLRCAVASLRFRDGIAEYDRRVAVETARMTIVSSGAINFRNETLDVGFVPKPRKDAPGIGVGAGDLVGIARLRGPLTAPELGVDALGAAKAGLKAYSAVATAGVSLVIGGLLDKHFSDPHPCQTARTGVTDTGDPASSLESTVDSTVDKVKSGLKKLFDF